MGIIRADSILKIRPSINANLDCESDIESFQNTTLRPLLKFQNDFSLALLKAQSNYIKLNIDFEKPEEMKLLLEKYLSSDKTFRMLFIGSILGLMSLDELDFYFKYKSEFNKRLLTMQFERFIDKMIQLN